MKKWARLMAGGLALCAGLAGCGGEPPTSKLIVSSIETGSGQTSVPGQLVCLADSKQEAEQIAQDYGIELLSFEDGVALFSTEEELMEVIRRGQENGLPALSYNHIHQTMS